MNMNYSLNGIIGAAHTNERTHTIWRVEFFGINFQSADGMKYEYLLSSRVTYSSGKRERPYMCVCGSVTGPTACFMSYTCAVKCVKCILISIETLCVLLEFQMDYFSCSKWICIHRCVEPFDVSRTAPSHAIQHWCSICETSNELVNCLLLLLLFIHR